MTDGARLVHDFQPPFGAVAKLATVSRIMSEHAIAASSQAAALSGKSTGKSLECEPCRILNV
jgi:hypothetical protein